MRKPTKTQVDFWESELSKHNLGLDRGLGGKDPITGKKWLSHQGDANALEIQESVNFRKDRGKRPKGVGPD